MRHSHNNHFKIPLFSKAMDRFKMLIRQDVGINLRSRYNTSLTSR